MGKRHQQLKRGRYYHLKGFGCTRHELEKGEPWEDPAECWCGETNAYFAPVRGTCGGTGMLDCLCGGDQCVCHNHGEVECFGCEDCERDDDGDNEFNDDLNDHLYYGVAAG